MRTSLLAAIAAVILGIVSAAHADTGPLYLPVVLAGVTWPLPTPTPSPTPTPTPLPPTPPNAANLHCTTRPCSQLCAWISDPAPQQNSTVTAYARLILAGAPVPGQLVTTTWHYKSTTPVETCTTASDGIAACARQIGRATAGYTVLVDVAAGALSASTWFTPQ